MVLRSDWGMHVQCSCLCPSSCLSPGSVCRCVGWYHSHPHFAAHPSIIDIKNQVNQQHQYRWAIRAPLTDPICPSCCWSCPLNPSYSQSSQDSSAQAGHLCLRMASSMLAGCRAGHEELYIAAIVSPYDEQAQGDASAVTWFHVAHEVGRIPGPNQDPLQAGCRPMALQVGWHP